MSMPTGQTVTLPPEANVEIATSFRVQYGTPPVTVGYVFPPKPDGTGGFTAWVLRYRRLDGMGPGYPSLDEAAVAIIREAGF